MNYFAVDSGTTNSRVWLIRNGQLLAKTQVPVGVRNTAVEGNNHALMRGVQQAFVELGKGLDSENLPQTAIAAGMITSNLGLHEVKHVQAPVGIQALAKGIQTKRFEETGEILFYFIPGVRSGPSAADLENVDQIDIMRGEETEVLGALETFRLTGSLLYVHLGSHTKLIYIDDSKRISHSASTLAGELLHSIQQQTVLRISLPENLSDSFHEDFFLRGWKNCEDFGLTRTLYHVRIFDLNSQFPRESLQSFLMGAILRQEFVCLRAFAKGRGISKVVLSGLPQLQPAWTYALTQEGFEVSSLTAEETEHAFLTGLLRIFDFHKRLSI